MLESLKQLTDKYEKASVCPVSVEKMSPEFLKVEINGIVAFEITIEKMEGAYKLSQNRDDKNQARIIEELALRKEDGSTRIAQAMKNIRLGK